MFSKDPGVQLYAEVEAAVEVRGDVEEAGHRRVGYHRQQWLPRRQRCRHDDKKEPHHVRKEAPVCRVHQVQRLPHRELRHLPQL